ncbi:MAG: glycosyltransferase family 2 protein, partial [Aridibacter famidurans]|nr:glycosyltransferase family 2 protein [Aridibacter famidurans]
MSELKTISLVAPVYNEEELIETFYARASEALKSISDIEYEIVMVDDGSSDSSYAKLLKIAKADSRVKLVKFSKNFGHQKAITAGIDMACGDAVVIIDADLQDPPEVIEEFVRKWNEGYDVVFGKRTKRDGESLPKRLTAWTYYRFLRFVTQSDIPADVGDFRLM